MKKQFPIPTRGLIALIVVFVIGSVAGLIVMLSSSAPDKPVSCEPTIYRKALFVDTVAWEITWFIQKSENGIEENFRHKEIRKTFLGLPCREYIITDSIPARMFKGIRPIIQKRYEYVKEK